MIFFSVLWFLQIVIDHFESWSSMYQTGGYHDLQTERDGQVFVCRRLGYDIQKLSLFLLHPWENSARIKWIAHEMLIADKTLKCSGHCHPGTSWYIMISIVVINTYSGMLDVHANPKWYFDQLFCMRLHSVKEPSFFAERPRRHGIGPK